MKHSSRGVDNPTDGRHYDMKNVLRSIDRLYMSDLYPLELLWEYIKRPKNNTHVCLSNGRLGLHLLLIIAVSAFVGNRNRSPVVFRNKYWLDFNGETYYTRLCLDLLRLAVENNIILVIFFGPPPSRLSKIM